MIEKGYLGLIHEIKKPSCQMPPSQAWINVYTDTEKMKKSFFFSLKQVSIKLTMSLPKQEAQEKNKFLCLLSFYEFST